MNFRLASLTFFLSGFLVSQFAFADQCEDAPIPEVNGNRDMQLAFENFATKDMGGHCWGFSQMHRLLVSGAHFNIAADKDSDEVIAKKLELLGEGIPVTINGFRSVHEFTQHYSTDVGWGRSEPKGVVRKFLKKEHRRIYYSPGSYIGTGFAWISSPGDKGQVKKIVRHLKDGKRPIVGINNGSAHAVFAEDYEELADGRIRIHVVDSNSTDKRSVIDCDKKGKCSFSNPDGIYGGQWQDVKISIVPPFSPNVKKLAEERCKMIAGKPYFDEAAFEKREERRERFRKGAHRRR